MRAHYCNVRREFATLSRAEGGKLAVAVNKAVCLWNGIERGNWNWNGNGGERPVARR